MAKGQTDTILSRGGTTVMHEVTVKASKILMVQDGDTLVYNADLLQMSSGTMLDELINSLPEARISPDGLISVKGEPVSELLIEGRDFFHGDPAIALRNLPAYTVKKVKVYRKVPRDAYLTRKDKGIKARNTDPLVMDIRLKPLYQNGIIANVESASGIPTQAWNKYLYLDRMFGLHYNKQRSLSGYASANNVNDKGTPHSKGEWKSNISDTGEHRHHIGGIDYTYTNPDNKMNVSGMFRLGNTISNQRQESSEMRFLEDGKLHNLSSSASDMRKNSATWSSQFFYPAKVLTIDFRPRVSIAKSKSKSGYRSASFSEQKEGNISDILDYIYNLNEDGFKSVPSAVNRQSRREYDENGSINIGFTARSTIKPSSFKSPLVVSIMCDFSSNTSTAISENLIDYTTPGMESVNKHQYCKSPSSRFTLNLEAAYTLWNFSNDIRSGNINLSILSDFQKTNHNNRLYDIDSIWHDIKWDASGEILDESELITHLDERNSYNVSTKEYNQNVNLNGVYNLSRDLGLDAMFKITLKSRHLYDNRISSDVNVSRNNLLATPSIGFHWKMLSFNYSFRTVLPELRDITGRIDDHDPMLIYTTNPSLQNSHIHTPSVGYSQHFDKNRASISIRGDFELINNAIKRMAFYNPQTGVTTIQTRNINGDWRTNIRSQYRHILGKQKRWQLSTAARISLENDNEYDRVISDAPLTRYKARLLRLNVETEINYNYQKWLLSLHGECKYQQTFGERQHFYSICYTHLLYGGVVKTPDFHGLSLTTDFFVQTDIGLYNTHLNRSYMIWNASLMYDLNERWGFIVEGSDLLQQLTSVSTGSSALGWTEIRRITRSSYFLLHVAYRFNLLPKKRQ